VSKDYSDLDPAILKPSLSDGTDLKPSITTDSYSGGPPSAPGDLKPSVVYPDGRIKEGLLYLGELAPSILRVGAAISATITYLSRLMTTSTTTPFYSGTTDIVDSSSTGDYREIQPGRCLDFDGSTQYVAINGSGVAITDCTFCVWVNTLDRFSKIYDQGADGRLGFGTAGGPLFQIFTDSKQDFNNPPEGEWYLATVIFSGGNTVEVFFNDQSQGSRAISYPSTIITSDAKIGISIVSSASFEGKLFDFRIYNRVLTDAEITALYRQGLQPDSVVEGQPDATNLVGRWLLDDNSQTTAYDSSGNGNHGTIVGYASGMLYEGSDVPYSAQNLVGYSEGASSTFVPRDESDPANDVLGNPLDYTGTVPKYATPVDAPCLTFDGTSQNPITLQSSWDYSGDFSLSAWFKSDNAAVEYYLFGHPTLTTRCLQVSTSGEIELFAGGTSDGVNAIRSGWENAFTHQSLNHVVLVWNSQTSQATLYVNGVSFGTQDLTTPIATGSITYNGRRTTDRNAGLTFDCRVYDYALTAEQVFNLPDNTILWLPLSEGDGNTVYDVVNGDSYTITSYASTMWTTATQDEFFYSFENGCRESSGVAIPALADGSAAADSNPLTGLPGLLNSDSYNLNLLPEPDVPYQRSAIPGATFDGVGDYVDVGAVLPGGDESTDNPFHCKVTFLVTDGVMQDLMSNGSDIPPVAWRLRQDSDRKISFRVYDLVGENQESITTDDALTDATWYDVELIYAGGGSSGMTIKINGEAVAATLGAGGSYTAMHNVDEHYVGAFAPFDNLFDSFCSTTIASAELVGYYKYDFRENNGLVIPDRSGNGNDGTLVVNSSLSQIFAPTALETAYTLGDGRTRPHYVTVDSPNETDFRTEII
jgi:hypothetical protein